jgi:hypothetical protein
MLAHINIDVSAGLEIIDTIGLKSFPESFVGNNRILANYVFDVLRKNGLVVGKVCIETDLPVYHTSQLDPARVDESLSATLIVVTETGVQNRIDVEVEIGDVYVIEIRLLFIERVPERLPAIVGGRATPFPAIVSKIFVVKFVG